MQKKQFGRALIIIICLYLIVTTVKAIVDLWRAGDKLTVRESKVAVLKKEQEALLQKKALVNNPNYLEKVARDQLGMSKPGEQIIVIPKELLVDSTPVASPDASPNWQKWARLLF